MGLEIKLKNVIQGYCSFNHPTDKHCKDLKGPRNLTDTDVTPSGTVRSLSGRSDSNPCHPSAGLLVTKTILQNCPDREIEPACTQYLGVTPTTGAHVRCTDITVFVYYLYSFCAFSWMGRPVGPVGRWARVPAELRPVGGGRKFTSRHICAEQSSAAVP